MFDVNPNPHGGDSALEMGDIFEDSEFYRISKKEAKSIFDDMVKVVKGRVSRVVGRTPRGRRTWSTNRHKFSQIDMCGYVQSCGWSFLVRGLSWSSRVER